MRRSSFLFCVWTMSGALMAFGPTHAQQADEPGGVLLSPAPQTGQDRTLRVTPPGESEITQSEKEGLTSENVEESLPPNPTDQGTRPPGVLNEEDAPLLYELLQRVRRAPVSLEGEPIPRPNALASEPAKEMTPQQERGFSFFVDDYIE